MDLVISDTNVLVDIEDGDLTSVIFRLPYNIAVPDVLFELELREKHSHLLQVGLKIKSLTAQFVKKVEDLSIKYPKPSIIDHVALALALQERCPLLTGDRNLRMAATDEGVKVHGTIWIVNELLKAKLIEQSQAKHSFDSMKQRGSRLPWGDVENLLNRNFNYTQVVSKFGRQAGLKAAANRFSRRGLVLTNTTLFARIDLRRFEPAWRPNFETTWV